MVGVNDLWNSPPIIERSQYLGLLSQLNTFEPIWINKVNASLLIGKVIGIPYPKAEAQITTIRLIP
jgi:hypothetical protein